MTISNYEFGGLSLPINSNNSYVNATALCKRYAEQTGKQREPYGWLRGKRTQETIDYVASQTGIPAEALVQVVQGGNNPDEQGTFLHPDLAIPFASWLSVEFEYKVTKIIQQRIVESSSSQLTKQVDDLWKVVNAMYVYLQGAAGLNRTIHTGIHNQSQQINPALREIESLVSKYQSPQQ